MKPIPFDYFAPTSVDEALTHLNELGYAGKVLAGGQSLIPAMNFRMARPGALVDLNNIPDLAYIRPNADGSVAVGTMTRDSAVEKHAVIAERFPLIAEVMTYIAHPQIRNRGTFGGAIAHADPAAQLPALSLLMNAELKIQKQGGQRVVAAEEFFFGPFMTVIEPEELLTEVLLRPLPRAHRFQLQTSFQAARRLRPGGGGSGGDARCRWQLQADPPGADQRGGYPDPFERSFQNPGGAETQPGGLPGKSLRRWSMLKLTRLRRARDRRLPPPPDAGSDGAWVERSLRTGCGGRSLR